MGTKHIAARWEVKSPEPARYPKYRIVDAEGNYVAEVAIMADGFASDRAHLIATTPELLSELRHARSIIAPLAEEEESEGRYDRASEAIDRIDEVIAKATQPAA